MWVVLDLLVGPVDLTGVTVQQHGTNLLLIYYIFIYIYKTSKEAANIMSYQSDHLAWQQRVKQEAKASSQ